MNQTVICLGALDVQLRPVDAIPDGQGVALVEQIRFSPAGAAGGTSLTLASSVQPRAAPVPLAPTRSVISS